MNIFVCIYVIVTEPREVVGIWRVSVMGDFTIIFIESHSIAMIINNNCGN